MPRKRYSVTVRYEQEREISVWAEDEAVEIVEGWNGILTAEANGVEEAD